MIKLVRKAFTLIELLVVIAIIGILSGLIVVATGGMTQKATIAKAQVFSNSLRNSLMMNLVAEYDLNGDATDSWKNNDGVVSGATYTANCISGGCYSFDGSDDYIDLGDYDDIPAFWFDAGNWTIFAWIKINATPVDGTIFGLRTGSDQDFRIGINSSNKPYITWVSYPAQPSYSTTIGPTALNDKSWHYVGAKRDGGIITLYTDGIVVGTDATVGTKDITWNNWYARWGIGSIREGCCTTFEAGHWSSFFNGLIDEVRVYNAAMPTSQIKEQYLAGLNRLLANDNINAREYNERINSIANQ